MIKMKNHVPILILRREPVGSRNLPRTQEKIRYHPDDFGTRNDNPNVSKMGNVLWKEWITVDHCLDDLAQHMKNDQPARPDDRTNETTSR